MTSPSTRSTRLAELAAPTRGRARYAPLTAGLLARKGEAAPASSPLFAADALGLAPSLAAGARLQLAAPEREPADEEPEPDIRAALRPWRSRKTEPEPEANGFDHTVEAHTSAGHDAAHAPRAGHDHGPRPRAAESRSHHAPHAEMRAALTVELELEMLARLVLEARRRGSSPESIIEAALIANMPATGACPLCDSFHVAP